MIKFVKNKEIDYQKWDDCIKTSQNGNIYSLSFYLDTVCDGWNALIENDYEAVFSLTFKKKFGVDYLIQPVFSQQLGIFSKTKISLVKCEDFFRNIPKIYRFVNIHLNEKNPIFGSKHKTIKHRNIILDLNHHYSIVRTNYSKNHKRNLKKAEKSKLQIHWNEKPENIIKLYKQGNGKKFRAMPEDTYKILHRLIYKCIHKGYAFTAGVYTKENTLCAGCFILKSQKRLVFLFSGYNEDAKQMAVMHFLIDSILQKYAKTPVIFDFEGSDNESLSRFYRGFGANETFYPQLIINRLPFYLRPIYSIYRKFR